MIIVSFWDKRATLLAAARRVVPPPRVEQSGAWWQHSKGKQKIAIYLKILKDTQVAVVGGKNILPPTAVNLPPIAAMLGPTRQFVTPVECLIYAGSKLNYIPKHRYTHHTTI